MSMLYRSLVCKFGGVQIAVLCRLVKPGVGKTCAMVRGIRCNGVEKEGRQETKG